VLNFTTEQLIILGLVLLLGWLLGLMSRSGGAKWRRELEQERAAHSALRHDHDARIAAANARIADLESRVPATGVGTAGAIGAAARGKRDDLSLIHGIGPEGENRLNDLGIHSYRDIEKMSASDEAALEGRMGAEPGLIERQQWREQAALLRAGKLDDHRERFFR
jgi:predicted flap endonuclease-1-like 5' DNA nuclease